MNLMCRLEHLAGQSILVQGTSYPIGENGLCLDVADEDANILLDQQGVWALVHPEDFTREKGLGDPFRNVAQPEGMAHVELPKGTELDLPPDLKPVVAKVPGRRGRPKKGQEAT